MGNNEGLPVSLNKNYFKNLSKEKLRRIVVIFSGHCRLHMLLMGLTNDLSCVPNTRKLCNTYCMKVLRSNLLCWPYARWGTTKHKFCKYDDCITQAILYSTPQMDGVDIKYSTIIRGALYVMRILLWILLQEGMISMYCIWWFYIMKTVKWVNHAQNIMMYSMRCNRCFEM